MSKGATAAARDVLAVFCKNCGSQQSAASVLRVSPSHLSRMLAGERDIPDRILKKLGFRYDVQIVRIA